MGYTMLDKGVVTCACGSASFVGVNTWPSGIRSQYRMTRNWDLTLTFEGGGPYPLHAPHAIYCAGCGNRVGVSPAVTVTGGDI